MKRSHVTLISPAIENLGSQPEKQDVFDAVAIVVVVAATAVAVAHPAGAIRAPGGREQPATY